MVSGAHAAHAQANAREPIMWLECTALVSCRRVDVWDAVPEAPPLVCGFASGLEQHYSTGKVLCWQLPCLELRPADL